MAGISLAKDFHRLLKRIGPLTEGQASIDSVDWDNDTLTSFDVTIRPNAGFYKLGRFKFTVIIPDGYCDGTAPWVQCKTQLPHPNIDPWDEDGSNVCLNLFSDGTWNQSYGLEGIVLGILFIMHNPNLDDMLCSDFPDITETTEDFEKGIKEYMATGAVDGYEYEIDFRVVDGVFTEYTEETSEQAPEQNPDDDSSPENGNRDDNTTSPVIAGITHDDVNNIDDDMDEDIKPVRFMKQEGDSCGAYFYTNFGASQEWCEHLVENNNINTENIVVKQESVQQNCDIQSGNVDNENEHQEMESDDVACETSQQSDNSEQGVLKNGSTVQDMDCSESSAVQSAINSTSQDNAVRPLQRALTVFGEGEGQFRTIMPRSASMPINFNRQRFQTFFSTTFNNNLIPTH